MKRDKSLHNIVFTGLFAALIMISTAYIGHIPIGNGYLHFGDVFIFLAASLLPLPYACLAACIGAGLADLLTAPIWVIATVLIKTLMAACFTSKKQKIICKRNILAILPVAVLTIGGYYVAEAILFGNWQAPVVGVIGNTIQVVGSVAGYIVIGLILDKMKIKDKF